VSRGAGARPRSGRAGAASDRRMAERAVHLEPRTARGGQGCPPNRRWFRLAGWERAPWPERV